jgi:hypothetical protein
MDTGSPSDRERDAGVGQLWVWVQEEPTMFGNDRADATAFKRLARRVENILEAAKIREQKGQRLALEIDAKFQLHEMGAVQFQLASAILEEVGGMQQEEIVSELLSLGLAAVLDGAARAAETIPSAEDLDEMVAGRRGVPFYGTATEDWLATRVIH